MKPLILFIAALAAPLSGLTQELDPLSIIRSDGTTVELSVEMADEPDEIATGMMFREQLPDDQGMLFDFGQPREANMYMKNVPIYLDMLFLLEDGEVAAIAEYATPQSLRIINPGFPVKGVLELAGGAVDRLNLAPGDRIEHRIFQSSMDDTPVE